MMLNNRSKLAIIAAIAAISLVVATAAACSENRGGPPPSRPHTPQGETSPEGPLARVPDLRGYPLEALAREFENLGLTLSLAMLISDEPEDTVLIIGRMGQLVPVPASIEVFVSGGEPGWAPEDTSESVPKEQQQQQYETMEFGGISWLVLEEEEEKALLLSELVLFDRRYNDQLTSTTWETSTIRGYLNNEFLYSFSPEDRERIAETRVINGERLYTYPYGDTGLGFQSWPVPAGNDTYDRVFLLSYDEQRRYFANDAARMARVAEGHPRLGSSSYTHWWWWLRSPGDGTFKVVLISDEGWDSVAFEVTQEVGIRPALWLYINP